MTRSSEKMRTSVAVLTLSLFYLCVAEEAPNPQTLPSSSLSLRGSDITAEQTFAILGQLLKTARELEDLRREVRGNRVAFGASAVFNGNLGPFRTGITLVYKHVFSNTGAYNPATGIFTAPVRGVYYFTICGHSVSSRSMELLLVKNGKLVITAFNHPGSHHALTATNGMAVQLEAKEQVYVTLHKNTWIFGNGQHVSTFSGFLLFPL